MITWPPENCSYEKFCQQNAWPSAYLGCTCWFWTHGGELAEDGCHVGLPPVVDGVVCWQPQFPAAADA